MDQPTTEHALQQLEPLVGQWSMRPARRAGMAGCGKYHHRVARVRRTSPPRSAKTATRSPTAGRRRQMEKPGKPTSTSSTAEWRPGLLREQLGHGRGNRLRPLASRSHSNESLQVIRCSQQRLCRAEQIWRIRGPESLPSRSIRTAIETLSIESRLTVERLGTGSSPGSRPTSLARPRIVAVHGAVSARRARDLTPLRDRPPRASPGDAHRLRPYDSPLAVRRLACEECGLIA